MYARKIAQIAESRRHLRKDSGSLTYRRSKKRARKAPVKRERRYSRGRPLFLILLFFVTQFFLLQSPLFQFQSVEIEGADLISETQIEKKLALNEEASYWELSPDSLTTSLTGVHQLASADVSVSFPGRVEVRVQERTPDFLVAFRKNTKKWYSADEGGIVLEKIPAKENSLKFLVDHPVKGGTQVRETDMQVVRFFQQNLTPELRKDVRAINIGQNRDISLKVLFGSQPIWVKLGRPEKLDYKLFLLSELMTQLGPNKSGILSVDLRYSAPVVRKRKKKASKKA